MTSKALKTGFAIAAALLAALPAAAQSSRMRVNIPFSFLAGETTMPAGAYFVNLSETSRNIALETYEKSIQLPVNAPSVRRGEDRLEYGALLFEKVGSVHVLKRVWNRNHVEGCALYPSRAERDLKDKNEPTITIAWAR